MLLMNSIAKWRILVLVGLCIMLLPFASSTITATLVDANGDNLSALEYDRYNVNLTSNSFRDNSIINPNAYLKICSDDLDEILNKYVTLAYASESGNITMNILDLPALINNTDQSNCSYLDIDISSYHAFYPGIPFLLISDYKNFTNYTAMKLNSTKLNGSFLVGASVDEVGGTTYFRVVKVFDSRGNEINQTGSVIMTLIGSNGSIVDEKLTTVGGLAGFNYNFVGGERLFVNGLLSLEVKIFEPCGTINESGYYFLNSSKWNVGDECVVINASDVTVNFANKTVDGDGNQSYAEGLCGVKVLDGERVSIVDVRTDEFYRGVCILNSTDVVLSGTSAQVNRIGIYVHNSTDVNINGLVLSNNETEFMSDSNSVVSLENIKCPSANFSLESKDVIVKAVENPPPDEAGFTNVSQWLWVSRNGESWANIKFMYSLPLPHNVLLSSVTVWENNATNVNGSWVNGTWEMIPTSKIDPVNRYFYTDNITNFSIFAPMGEELNVTQPQPKEVPSEGFGGMAGGGGGGAPAEVPPRVRTTMRTTVPTPPQLDLKLYNESVVLQQGENTKIKFNLTNIGDVIIGSAVVSADVRRGWDFSGAAYEDLKPKEVKQGELYLKVYENEIPGTYVVAVSAKMENLTLDTEYLTVVVVPRELLPKLTILEAAPAVTFFENTINDYEMLVKNTGDFYLENITAKLINCKCIPEINGSYNLNIGEQKTLIFKMKAGNVSDCRCVLVLRSNKYDALAFSPLLVSIVPAPPPMPLIFPVILAIWTALTAYVLWRSYRKRGVGSGE